MTEWVRARSCPRDNHLPPPEYSPLLMVTPKGKVKASKKFEIELDEFGVPIPEKAIELVSGAVEYGYRWPEYTNVHHLAWPRRLYETGIEREYRGSPTLMIHMQVQSHNLLHELTLPPPMPSYDVMRGRVEEERHARNLFELGRSAVRFTRWSENLPSLVNETADIDWLKKAEKYYRTRGEISADRFYDYMEHASEGVFGILPDLEMIGNVPLEFAVQCLGRRVGVEAIDFRRTTQLLTAA